MFMTRGYGCNGAEARAVMGNRNECSADCIRICPGRDRSWPVGRDPLGDPGPRVEGYSFPRIPRYLGKPVLLVAAGVMFYALLANFPGIAALISIYGLFADPASVANHLDAIANVTRVGRSTGLDIGQRELLDIGQCELRTEEKHLTE